MNLQRLKADAPPPHENGSAALIVLVLLSLMAVFIVANSLVLRQLKREVKLVETRQLKLYPALTNGVPAEAGPLRKRH